MLSHIIMITSAAFAAGAAGIAFINKHRKDVKNGRWLKYFLYLAIVLSTGLAIAAGDRFFFALALVICAIGIYEITAAAIKGGRSNMFIAAAVLLYILPCEAFIQFAASASPRDKLLVYFMVVLFDGFSQLCGQLFGKRKLSPRISPNKTIEGAVGGAVLTVACTALVLIGNGGSDGINNIFIWLACPAALAGDLLASWYKRRTGIKDFSRLIPGHGGVLDRFDSFIAAGAVYWAMM